MFQPKRNEVDWLGKHDWYYARILFGMGLKRDPKITPTHYTVGIMKMFFLMVGMGISLTHTRQEANSQNLNGVSEATKG